MKIYLKPRDGSGRVIVCDSHEESYAAIEKLHAEGVTEIDRSAGDVICDFCSDPTVRWLYLTKPGAVIQLGDVTHADADGQWGACATCHAHIQAGEWKLLAAHSLSNFYKLHPDTEFEMPPLLLAMSIDAAHGHFRDGWDGSAPQSVTPDADFLRDHGIADA